MGIRKRTGRRHAHDVRRVGADIACEDVADSKGQLTDERIDLAQRERHRRRALEYRFAAFYTHAHRGLRSADPEEG